MKRHTLFSLLLLSASYIVQAQEITFSEAKYNFGTIHEKNGKVSHDFRFKNTGDQPLTVKNVITGCGCTSTEWSKEAYKPGEEGIIRMTYHPEGRIEKDFFLIAEVYTNIKGNAINLEIQGIVERVVHPPVNYYQPTKEKRGSIVSYQAKDDYEVILQRFREQLYPKNGAKQLDEEVGELLRQLSDKGKWGDLDYDCFFRTNWEPVQHLQRIKTIALAYTNPQSDYYGNEVLYDAISTGLSFWDEKDPKCHNWWYNQISVPQTLAEILAVMEAGTRKLSPAVAMSLMEKMEKRSDPRKWTGANKMDIAIHHLARGCVLKNDSVVRVNASEIFYPVKIVESEGIQEDLSYHQHGPQLYIGGYGTVFVDNVTRMATILSGTDYAMNDEQTKLFSDFVRKTYLNVFRGHHLDFSVTGRGVSRTGILDYGESPSLFESMKQIDPQHEGEYEAAAIRFSKKGDVTYGRTDQNTMYNRSDYMLHNRKKYDISVRTASTRTCKTESGNGENFYGTYMSDGATNIRVNGNEYTDIFPAWEWDKIPGTTLPAGEQKNKAEWGAKGKSNFTGGVSDGKYGVMTFVMDDYGMKAHKSWFLFDDEMICLGAGIESSLPQDIVTTVNQCHRDGEVQQMPHWIWHDSIAYYFPQKTNIQLRTGDQKGSWARINYNYPAAEISLPVFNLTINHGKSPLKAEYAYIVIPGIHTPEGIKQYDQKNISIESNTEHIQAVRSKKADVLQIVFFRPDTFRCGKLEVQAEKPCTVIVKGASGSSPEIRVADPTQKETFLAGKEVTIRKKK